MSESYIRISPLDNVAIALIDLDAGRDVLNVRISVDIPSGHKIALKHISQGETVIKYGYPIGVALKEINPGEHVHTHNLKTLLSGNLDYRYKPVDHSADLDSGDSTSGFSESSRSACFMGYPRKSGRSATRNEIWIINTVGCVNKTAEVLSRRME